MSMLRRMAGPLSAGEPRAQAQPSPNIWHWPEIYEIENEAQDVDGVIWSELARTVDMTRVVLDLGCGSGYHLPLLARQAHRVIGIEPHPPLVAAAVRRVSGLHNVEVHSGMAQRIPLSESTVDLVHARTAYFFGPGCEPGLREVDRVLSPGGAFVVVDLDGAQEPYGQWLARDTPHYDVRSIEEFFSAHGFRSTTVWTRWRFRSREQLRAVLGIEFSAATAQAAFRSIAGVEFAVAYRVRVRQKPTGLIVATHR